MSFSTRNDIWLSLSCVTWFQGIVYPFVSIWSVICTLETRVHMTNLTRFEEWTPCIYILINTRRESKLRQLTIVSRKDFLVFDKMLLLYINIMIMWITLMILVLTGLPENSDCQKIITYFWKSFMSHWIIRVFPILSIVRLLWFRK